MSGGWGGKCDEGIVVRKICAENDSLYFIHAVLQARFRNEKVQ